MCCSPVTRRKLSVNQFAGLLLLALLSKAASVAGAQSRIVLDFADSPLSEVLDRFSEQSGLQVIYEARLVAGKTVSAAKGTWPVNEALNAVLRGTGLGWRFVDDNTVAIFRPRLFERADGSPRIASPEASATHEIAELADIDVDAPQRIGAQGGSTSVYGFNKPLFETPRSVALIGEDTMDALALSTVEDLLRVTPGVFTTTRFGIQGSVDVRNVSADTYFRGMKRVTLQGHGRSVLAAMDTIEVVRGPASPIYGMGRIGGYTNMTPKSGRAKNGTYLLSPKGFVQGISGSYERAEISAGIGGPFAAFGRQGGYYLYGLLESSASYYKGVPVKQQVAQAASSIDNFVGAFRLESGANYQVSNTAGALTGRLTQELVDHRQYVRGSALANLDLNGNGRIGYLELHAASPVNGTLSAGNQPLVQRWAWPKDANGRYIQRVEDFPQVSGIPQTLYDYLRAHPEADPGGYLVKQGVGGPIPISGQVPLGMALDPRTTGYGRLDLRRAAAYERELKAQFLTAYADLISDIDPDLTFKNQLFFDSINQYKVSEQPGCCANNTRVWEDKVTLTARLPRSTWASINSLASVNVRYVESVTRGNVGNDYGSHRTDAMADTWVDSRGGMTPNTTFATAFDNPDITDDGSPWGTHGRSTDLQMGAGAEFDVDLFDKANVLIGGRIDASSATNIEYAGTYNPNVGTSADPGAVRIADERARDWDIGASWTASLSYQLGATLRPYVTFARSSLALDANNNRYTNNVLNSRNGHIGQAYLKEAGLKFATQDGVWSLSTSVYEQKRIDVSADDDFFVLTADVSATRTRGWETELRWAPLKNLLISLYGLKHKTVYAPNTGGVILVDARTLGFKDVKDDSGRVIYPAEAFLYGGRSFLVLPPGMSEYEEKQGSPNTQLGMNLNYQLGKHFGITFSGNYFSSTYSGRLKLTRLPQAYVFNTGASADFGAVHLQLDIANLFDRTWFRARTGDTLGDVLAQAMPDRRVQFTAKYRF